MSLRQMYQKKMFVAEKNRFSCGQNVCVASMGQYLLDTMVFLFLAINIVVRLPLTFQYPAVVQGVVYIPLISCLFPLIQLRFLRIFLFLFACSLPLYGSHSYNIHNIIFELYLSSLALLCLVQERQTKEFPVLDNKLPVLMGSYVLLACLSLLRMPLGSVGEMFSLWSWQDFFPTVLQAPPESTMYTLAAVNRLLLFFLFILQLARHGDRKELYRFLFLGVVTGAVVAAGVGILNYYHLFSLDWLRDTVARGRRLQSVFGNPGWFAEFLSISIPFILIGFLHPGIRNIQKILLFGVLVVCEMAILLTYSRTGWLIYPFVLVSCWFVFYLSKRIETGTLTWGLAGKTFIKVLVSVPITILISYFLVTGIIRSESSKTVSLLQQRVSRLTNPTTRKRIWRESMAIGREAPVYGLGYESYKYHVVTLASIPESWFSRKRQVKQIDFDTPHSHYIQLFLGNGIVGVFFWLAIVVYALVILFYDLKRNKNYFNIAVLLSIIAFHQYGLAQSMQYVGVIWFLVFLSFGYVFTLSEAVLPDSIRKSGRVAVFLLFLLTCTGALVYVGNFASHRLAEKYGLRVYGVDQDASRYAGFYLQEDWGTRGTFRWTGCRAVMKLEHPGVIRLQFSSNAPQMDIDPLVVDVLLNGRTIDKITFWECRTISRSYYIAPENSPEFLLEFRVSRTWKPKKDGFPTDYRMLGVAVSEPEYLSAKPVGDLGFYGWQIASADDKQEQTRMFKYRWTSKEAVLIPVKSSENQGTLFLKSHQPYIEKYPVEIELVQDGKLVGSTLLSDHHWHHAFFERIDTEKPLIIRTGRLWNPRREGYTEDPRDLGVAVALTPYLETKSVADGRIE